MDQQLDAPTQITMQEVPVAQIRLRAQEVPVAKTKKRNGTRRGFFKPSHPEKYEGNVDSIIYRSGMELRLMKHLDTHPSIIKWSSEETVIPYVKPTDGKVHRYFVDFKITRKLKTGEIRVCLAEVKWSSATAPPKTPKKKTRRFFAEQVAWQVNQAKWAEAKKVCERNGWEWFLITEKQLSAF